MIQEFLPALEAEIAEQDLGKTPVELYEPIRYLMQLGGKRIRPVLCLLAYSLFKDSWRKAVAPALGIEIFHNFTLMHDDLQDRPGDPGNARCPYIPSSFQRGGNDGEIPVAAWAVRRVFAVGIRGMHLLHCFLSYTEGIFRLLHQARRDCDGRYPHKPG